MFTARGCAPSRTGRAHSLLLCSKTASGT